MGSLQRICKDSNHKEISIRKGSDADLTILRPLLPGRCAATHFSRSFHIDIFPPDIAEKRALNSGIPELSDRLRKAC